MAVHAHTAPPFGASRRRLSVTLAAPNQKRDVGLHVHAAASDNHSLGKGVLYRPDFLWRALAYLANGDLPPPSLFRAPAHGRPLPALPPLSWASGPCPDTPPLPGGFPPKEAAPCLAYAAKCAILAAMGCLGMGMMVAGVAL